MFTGIVEQMALVFALEKEKNNINISFKSVLTKELKINQSIAHNGVCLTVVDIKDDIYTVTAIQETLNKSNLKFLKEGDKVNLERCMKMEDRLDGHLVQGHIDQTAECIGIEEEKGSYIFIFRHEFLNNITVEKGSVCVNGVSLTVIKSTEDSFSVAIIPYTYEFVYYY